MADIRQVCVPFAGAGVPGGPGRDGAGADHRVAVSPAQNREWADVTEGDFRAAELPGGHMYLVDAVDDVLALVAENAGTPTGQAP